MQFIEFKDNNGQQVAINIDKILLVRPSTERIIGVTEIIYSIDPIVVGPGAIQNFIQQIIVVGSFKDVVSKLNNCPVMN